MRTAADDARATELDEAYAAEATPEQQKAWRAAEERERAAAQAAALEQTIASQVARVERRVSRAFPIELHRHSSIALASGAHSAGKSQRPFSRSEYSNLAKSGALQDAKKRAAEWGALDPRSMVSANSGGLNASNRPIEGPGGDGLSLAARARLTSRRRSTRAIVMNIIGSSVLALEHAASEAARIARGEINLLAEASAVRARAAELGSVTNAHSIPHMGVYRVAEHSDSSEASSEDGELADK